MCPYLTMNVFGTASHQFNRRKLKINKFYVKIRLISVPLKFGKVDFWSKITVKSSGSEHDVNERKEHDVKGYMNNAAQSEISKLKQYCTSHQNIFCQGYVHLYCIRVCHKICIIK